MTTPTIGEIAPRPTIGELASQLRLIQQQRFLAHSPEELAAVHEQLTELNVIFHHFAFNELAELRSKIHAGLVKKYDGKHPAQLVRKKLTEEQKRKLQYWFIGEEEVIWLTTHQICLLAGVSMDVAEYAKFGDRYKEQEVGVAYAEA